MGRFSREKGKRGERELAEEFSKALGVKARRGVQFQGGPDSPDVVTDIPEIHIECKRTESFNLYGALDQAVNDAGNEKIPLVCHRKNNKPWVIVLRLDDLKNLTTILNRYTNDDRETDTTTTGPALDPHGFEHPRTKRD